MKLASIAKILACKNRLLEKCSLSLQDTNLVRFLLHESKLKCMSEKKVLHSWICKTSLSGWKLRCKIFAKISISSPYNPKKKSSEKKMFKTKVVDNFTLYLANFFILTKSQKCGSDSQKCLAEYCPKSFFDQNFCKLTEHYQNFLCTWKLIFPPYLLISTCLFATFFYGPL